MVQKVTEDLENLRLNTAISAMMELTNLFTKEKVTAREGLTTLVHLVAPFAPHMGEELWARLGHEDTITYATWPTFDPALVVDDMVKYSIQVNGKMRGQIELPADVSKDDALGQAKTHENVARFLEGKTMRREIFVPKRMINFVAN